MISFYRSKIFICIGLMAAVLVALAVYGKDREKYVGILQISEVCSVNDTTAHDENGNYGADYIELYNVSDESVNLGGFGISDNENNFYKYVLPNVELAAHSAMVLWCDENAEDFSAYAEDYVIEDLHGLGFGISRQGEKLYLTDPYGRLVDSVAIPGNISDGMSYQITIEDSDEYVIGTPTLYRLAENREEIAPVTHDLTEPIFTIDGGWYEDSVVVALECAEGDIYYTLDGSEPDQNAFKYEEPITVTNRSNEPNIYSAIESVSISNPYIPDDPVDKATVIKAIAIKGDQSSEVATRTYFVGLDKEPAYQNTSVLSLTVDPEDLFGYENGIYVSGVGYDRYQEKYGIEDPKDDNSIYTYANYAKEGIGWEREAQIEFYTEDHQEVLRQKIGIRIHGGWSTSYNQKGFNLYAREEYDGNEDFLYDFFGKQTNRLMLRTGGFRDVYATKLRDVLNQRLVSDRDLGCQDAMPCIVFINGEFWGLYNLQEKVGAAYVEANYGIDEDDVIVLKNPYGVDTEEARSYTDIADYAEEHDLSDNDNYEWVTDRIDIQSYIDYYCFQIYVGNCDAIINNLAMWRSREIGDGEYEDGKWRFLLYDTDDSAGMVEGYTDVDTDSFISGHWSRDPLGDNGDGLFTALLENASFKEQFVATFMEMADVNFDYDRVHEMLVEMAVEYCNADVASQERFRGDFEIPQYELFEYDGEFTTIDYWNDVQVIDDFYKERRDYIVSYMFEDLGLVND